MESKYFKFGIVALAIILVIFINGCNHKTPKVTATPPQFKPSVNFELDKSSISIKDNTVSKDFITATITRWDADNIDTVFVLKFPEEKQTIYPTNTDGERIRELSTKSLKGKGNEDVLQFKIFGKTVESDTSVKSLKLELWWNNTKLDNKDKTISITVK